MRIGFIGCGGMGSTHYKCLKLLSESHPIEVTALADAREECLDKAAKFWPNAKRYSDGLDLIRDEDVETVFICVPSYLHTDMALAAMKKNMNIFLEKPACLKREECELLLAQHKVTPVKVMVGQVVRSMPEYLFLKDVYEKKTYGNLRSIVMQRISGDVKWGFEDWFHDENRSGSVILDLHIHDLDFLRYMLGEPDYADVHTTKFDSGMINQVITNYKFGNIAAMAEGVWHSATKMPFEANYRADFDNATIRFNSTATDKITIYTASGDKIIPELDTKEMDNPDSGINVTDLGAYYLEDEYFIDCVLNEKENTRATLHDGIKSVLAAISELEKAKANG
jgi:hypothetical protein